MKHTLTILILAVSLSSFGQTAKPDLVSSAGDNFTSAGQQISWSLGEVVIETFSSGSIILTQGFHQCSYLVTALKDPVLLDFKVIAFPNPASDFISVQIFGNNQPMEKYQIYLTDMQGKKLFVINPTSDSPKINLQNYKPGTYFLSVAQNEKILKTFKIIKSE